ncbi:MAG: helix-turn-helix domain-containing protein, partial [Candidatus Binatia bacterium]
PPLRERRGDIPELIRYFIAKIKREMGTSIVGLSEDAERLLYAHSWPGNVRELENELVRACVLAAGRTLTARNFRLSGEPSDSVAGGDVGFEELVRRRLKEVLRQYGNVPPRDLHAVAVSWIEKPLIELALEHTGGNQLRAADLLGINRNTLRKKITTLGIRLSR